MYGGQCTVHFDENCLDFNLVSSEKEEKKEEKGKGKGKGGGLGKIHIVTLKLEKIYQK